jgi:hypothetical protein
MHCITARFAVDAALDELAAAVKPVLAPDAFGVRYPANRLNRRPEGVGAFKTTEALALVEARSGGLLAEVAEIRRCCERSWTC